jgi:hypothetical protein
MKTHSKQPEAILHTIQGKNRASKQASVESILQKKVSDVVQMNCHICGQGAAHCHCNIYIYQLRNTSGAALNARGQNIANNAIFYVGQTNDMNRRLGEHRGEFGHGITMEQISMENGYTDAAAVEQALISNYRDNGTVLVNLIAAMTGRRAVGYGFA